MQKSATYLVMGLMLIAAPFVTALVPTDALSAVDPARYTVGFYKLPSDIHVGDLYNGGKVVRLDEVLQFIVVETFTGPLFEYKTAQDDQVRYVELTPWMNMLDFTPNDPQYGSMYGPQQIGAPAAWDITLGSTSTVLCITDTGVRSTHEDLAGRFGGGFNYIANNANPADDNGHGTHVTGTAAASTNNGKGIAGIAQVTYKSAKVLNSAGSGTWDQVASGFRWCADNGAHVISSSLGGSSGATALSDAVTYAWGKGAVLVAAAGNSGPCSNCVGYPAAYANEMAVTCTTNTKALCSFSSTGPQASVAAPGNNIASSWYTSDTAYNTISGTSMSTPHVAGVAALVKSANPTWTNSQIRSRLESCVEDLGAAGRDSNFGYGLVRADLAVGTCSAPPPPACSGGPANNCFASPTTVPAAGGQMAALSTTGSTTESGEPLPCGNMGATVWYTWTPTSSGTTTVETVGPTYDTVLAVYTGSSLTGLTNVGCNDDIASGNTLSKVTFTATAGTTYRIQAGGYNGATGTLNLKVTAPGGTSCTGPVGNCFSTAVAITTRPYTNSKSTTGATTETGEPAPCGSIGATVWYSWTAPSSGTATVDTFTSNYDTVLAVYTGSTLTGLTNVGCNDDTSGSGNGLQSRVSWTATSGVTYRIQVGGYQGATGSLVFHLN